jgi:hypothetical protein
MRSLKSTGLVVVGVAVGVAAGTGVRESFAQRGPQTAPTAYTAAPTNTSAPTQPTGTSYGRNAPVWRVSPPPAARAPGRPVPRWQQFCADTINDAERTGPTREAINDRLMQLGAEGWELVPAFDEGFRTLCFRRPMP